MIKSYRDKDTERLMARQRIKTLPAELHRVALRRLVYLDAAVRINDLLVPPGNNLEKLRGSRKGQYSIRINRQWRICFVWHEGHAYEVEIIDYH
jgi:proteic killer suppression protein